MWSSTWNIQQGFRAGIGPSTSLTGDLCEHSGEMSSLTSPSFHPHFMLVPYGTCGKEPSANAGDLRDTDLILGQEDPLEEEMATHSSVLAWTIPWTETCGLQSMGLQRIGHDRAHKRYVHLYPDSVLILCICLDDLQSWPHAFLTVFVQRQALHKGFWGS